MAVTNTAILILGASGDLAKRKLIPALERLYRKDELDSSCRIIGSGRTAFTDHEFRDHFDVPEDFASLLHYHQGLEGIRAYVYSLKQFERVIIFFSLPPKVYGSTAAELSVEGFGKETTLIIEKPFGYDIESARVLNRELQSYFNELQIFRIDHYLAKEAVQNILVFRFANALFHPIWNSRYIESIQINALEDIGVEDRGAYFDGAGIIRDMVQNHLMQLLSLLTMEAPVSLEAEEIRNQKMQVLKALEVKRWAKLQYQGYHDEKGVPAGSKTETYAEIELTINNFRWTGIPIYVRTGKAVGRKGTEIGIRFKQGPKLLYNQDGGVPPNQIIFNIQPDAGILMDFMTKEPGADGKLSSTSMTFCYSDSFRDADIPEAYQKLLLDALKGDRTLFVSAQETELSWEKFAEALKEEQPQVYEVGKLPESALGIEWIEFEHYGSACRY